MKLCEIFSIFENVNIPDTTYGYWVGGNGNIIPVGLHDHEKVALAYGFGTDDDTGENPSTDALDKGWVRMIVKSGTPITAAKHRYLKPFIDIEVGRSPTTKAIYNTIEILRAYEMPNIDVSIDVYDTKKHEEFTSYYLHDAKKAIGTLKQIAQGRHSEK